LPATAYVRYRESAFRDSELNSLAKMLQRFIAQRLDTHSPDEAANAPSDTEVYFTTMSSRDVTKHEVVIVVEVGWSMERENGKTDIVESLRAMILNSFSCDLNLKFILVNSVWRSSHTY
jgi:hypothetical protein